MKITTEAKGTSTLYTLLDANGAPCSTRTSGREYRACVVLIPEQGQPAAMSWHSTKALAMARVSGYVRSQRLAEKDGKLDTYGWWLDQNHKDRKGTRIPFKGTRVDVVALQGEIAETPDDVRAKAKAKREAREAVVEGIRKSCNVGIGMARNGNLDGARAVHKDLVDKSWSLTGPKQRRIATHYAGMLAEYIEKAARGDRRW